MDINYELYKVFYYVATTLSFSEASKKLYISQSAVSQSIKALEGKLSQTLLANHNSWNPSLPVDRSELPPATPYVGIFWCHILNGFTRHSRICISKSSMQLLSAVSIS